MTMQGQGESQPGEPASLDSLAAMMGSEESEAGEESGENEEGSEESEVEDAEGEESPDEEAESEDADEPSFTIKYDGKEVTVKQSEAIELAQKGMDYTHKTMAHAENVKAFEAVKAEGEKYRQHNEAALNETVARLESVVSFMQAEIGDPPPIEWASQDAQYYLVQKEQYESRKGKLEKAQQALRVQQNEQVRQREALIAARIAQTQATLKSTLPDWDHAKELDLAKYVGEQGLTPDKSDMAFWDAGFWQMAHKARAYDELQAKKAELKPVSKLHKVIKPTANNQPPQLAKHQEKVKAHKTRPTITTLADLL